MRQKTIFQKIRAALGDMKDRPSQVCQYEVGPWRLAVDDAGKVLLRNGQQTMMAPVEDVRVLLRLLVRLYPEWVEDMLAEIDAELMEVETEKAMAVAEKTGLIGVEEERTRKVRRGS